MLSVNFCSESHSKFIAASEHQADGVTVKVVFTKPPGFSTLTQWWRGVAVSLSDFDFSGMPSTQQIQVLPGHVRE